MNQQQQTPPWSDGLARLVVASTLFGDLLTRLPGAFTPELFGTARSPRQHIARVIAGYYEKYGQRPTPEIVDGLLRVESEKLSEAEKEMLEREWEDTMDTEVPETGFVYDQIKNWIEFRRLETAILAAANALDKGPDALDEVRELLANGSALEVGGSGFAPVWLKDFLYAPRTQVKWLWRDYLTTGSFALLTGYTKHGKSTLAYPLAIAISRGQPFLQRRTRKTNVLILGVEESPRSIQERLQKFGATSFDRIAVYPNRLKNSPGVLAEVREFIKANDIGLLLIDTISRFWSVKDENDNAGVLREAEPLLDLAQATGCCVLALHHDGKNENAKGSRGASSLPGIADLILSLKRPDRESPRRLLLAEGRESETPARLDITLVNGPEPDWQVSYAEENGTLADTERVWRALTTPMGRKALEDSTGLSRERVLAALKALTATARIRSEGSTTGRRYMRVAPDEPGAGESSTRAPRAPDEPADELDES